MPTNSTSDDMRPGEKGTLTVLHSFFRIATPVFLGLSMLFTLDSNGVLWVMWRDNTLLAATLASIGLLMGGGWCAAAGRTVPATEVGGDYFDVVELPDGKLVVAIADVTGHGVGAGILSAMTKSALRSELGHDAAPHTVLENLNRTLYQVSQRGMFVTMAYLLLDRQAGIARIATAGHPPVMFCRHDGTIRAVRTTNPGLGMRPQGFFIEAEVGFAPGDRFLLYTDGVTEATNRTGEQFGDGRLGDLVAAGQPVPADQWCAVMLESVLEFRGSKNLSDDATVVAVGITS
jgi:sigma-B regulation protein RsbU (phosphoserine phosphatase)